MITPEWVTERRTQLQAEMRDALMRVEQLRGALALLAEIEEAMHVAPTNGVAPGA